MRKKTNFKELRMMKSDGGLCSSEEFSGCNAILSGPAGGIVGFSETSYPIIDEYNKFAEKKSNNYQETALLISGLLLALIWAAHRQMFQDMTELVRP